MAWHGVAGASGAKYAFFIVASAKAKGAEVRRSSTRFASDKSPVTTRGDCYSVPAAQRI